MCRVRGVVHGPAPGLTAPQKDRRPVCRATLDRAATLRPYFCSCSPDCLENKFFEVRLGTALERKRTYGGKEERTEQPRAGGDPECQGGDQGWSQHEDELIEGGLQRERRLQSW